MCVRSADVWREGDPGLNYPNISSLPGGSGCASCGRVLWEDMSCLLCSFAASVALHPHVALVHVNLCPLFSWGLALLSCAIQQNKDLHEYFKLMTLVLPGSQNYVCTSAVSWIHKENETCTDSSFLLSERCDLSEIWPGTLAHSQAPIARTGTFSAPWDEHSLKQFRCQKPKMYLGKLSQQLPAPFYSGNANRTSRTWL